jgi:hypothetical protein
MRYRVSVYSDLGILLHANVHASSAEVARALAAREARQLCAQLHTSNEERGVRAAVPGAYVALYEEGGRLVDTFYHSDDAGHQVRSSLVPLGRRTPRRRSRRAR